jgi:signal peptidase I
VGDLIRSVIAFAVVVGIIIGVEKFYKAQTKATIDAADKSMEGMANSSPHVDTTALKVSDVKAGDLVAYYVPGKPDVHRVARIAAVEGQLIESDEKRMVRIDGKSTTMKVEHKDWRISPIRIPRGCIYVMADHTQEAEDSVQFGPIPYSSVMGKIQKEN